MGVQLTNASLLSVVRVLYASFFVPKMPVFLNITELLISDFSVILNRSDTVYNHLLQV